MLAELQPEIDGGVHDPSDYVKVKVLTDDGVVEVTVPKGSPFEYTLENKTGLEPAAVGKQVRTLFVVKDDGADERPASGSAGSGRLSRLPADERPTMRRET